jgi:hypothetical protein
MAQKEKAGRNDPCPCGSHKKFKKCCGAKGPNKRMSMALLLVLGAAMIGALFAGLSSLNSDAAASGPGPGRVWSSEHGHWRDSP